MLSLSEKLMLLALHDEKGSIVFSASTALPYALAGALLIELLYQKKVAMENGKVIIVDRSQTGNELLDKALDLISSSQKLRSAKYWIQKFNTGIKGLKDWVLDRLVAQGILKREDQKILWVFPTKRYPMINAAQEHSIRSRIHQVVIQKVRPNQDDVALLSLVKACDLLNELFPKEERKRAKQRIKEIIEGEEIGRAVSTIVEEIMAALTIVLAATVASSSASS